MLSRFLRLFAFAIGLASALHASPCSAADPEPHPGFYFRLAAGPGGHLWGNDLDTFGVDGSMAFGWALGKTTALALDVGLRYERVQSQGPSTFEANEDFGLHLALLGDHYFEGTSGFHLQAGVGAAADAFTGSSSSPSGGGSGEPGGGQIGGLWPLAFAGVGYDWNYLGLLFRVQAEDARGFFPVGFAIMGSVRSF